MLRTIAKPGLLCLKRVPTSNPKLFSRNLAFRVDRPHLGYSRNRGQTRRAYARLKSEADERIEEIQEQYATARDEFEIAVEETEKKTVYAADDRAAAADELAKLKELYQAAVNESSPEIAREIQSRIGQRIRELDHAIQGLEKSAIEG